MKFTSTPTSPPAAALDTQPVQDQTASQVAQSPLARALEAIRVDCRRRSEEYLDESIAHHGGE